ncbi:MAG: redoxin domain-containing protein [Pseudohongiellaceae bacterium]
MRTPAARLFAIPVLVVSAGFISAAAAMERITDFALLDHDGDFHQLSRYADHQAVVLFVYHRDSEIVADALRDLDEVIEDSSDQSVAFLMIDSSPRDDKAAIALSVADRMIDTPVLLDDTQLVSAALGIKRAAEILVIRPAGLELIYRGALNDRFIEGSDRRRASEHYLADVLSALEHDEQLPETMPASSGEAIAYTARARHAESGLSYAEDVVPVLERRCTECHREGGIAPFAMSSHQVVQGWSPMIRETLLTKRMPPAQIDPAFVHDFIGVSHITPEETQTLVHWIEDGAQFNSNTDPLATAEREESKWMLGEPDMIVQVPEQQIPATGILDYRNVPVPLNIDKDVWVRAVEFHPGDKQVVHHIIAFSMGPDGLNQFDVLNQGIGLGAYAPGNQPTVFPENTGYPLKAGGGLFLQMHYTTSGKETVDASEIGLYLYDEPPRQPVLGGSAADLNIQIPANTGHFPMTAQKVFPKDSYLTMLGPHMHYRGKEASYTLIYPDGSEETLLSVPNYQFNWQKNYDFVEPKFIPAGTTLVFDGAFDNSAMNPDNPDPDIEITWGEQTFNEMFFGFYRFIEAME